MPTPVPNSFTSYVFSEQEVLEGSIFSPLHEQMIRTDLAVAAQELVNFDLDLDDKNCILQHAYLKAKVNVYQVLLDRSEEAKRLVEELAKAAAAASS